MASIFNVVYNVQTTSKSDGGLEKIISLIEKMGGQIEAINKTKIAPSGDTTGVDKVSKKLQEQDGIFKSLVKTAGAYLAFSVVKDAVVGIVQTGAAYESLQLRLNNLMGGAKEGQAVFKQLQEDAVKSPFDLDLLVSANAGLISSGENAKDARTNIEGLANAVAFAGKGNAEFQRMSENLAQIKNLGKASGADIKQFATAGVNIYPALAKSMGLPIEKIKEMEISYEDITKALNEASKEGGLFAGGLTSLMDSTGTKISNTMDSLKNTMFEVFEYIKPGINFLLDQFQSLMSVISGVVKFLRDNETIASVLGSTFLILGGAIALYNYHTKISAIWAGITTTALFLQTLATKGLSVAMLGAGLAGATMWVGITGGLILVVGGLVVLYKKFEGFRLLIAGIGSVFKQVFQNIKGMITGIGDYFKSIFSPIFTAIDNFKKGNYLEAGKNILQVGVNLIPAKIAVDMAKKAFAGTGDAFKKGVDERSNFELTERLKNGLKDKDATKAVNVAGAGSKIAGDAKKSLASSAQGATSSVKNITINLEALQKIQEQNINNRSDTKKILQDMNIGMTEILNNTNQTR